MGLEPITLRLEVLRAIQLRQLGIYTLRIGVEPMTLRLTVARSNQLSYGRKNSSFSINQDTPRGGRTNSIPCASSGVRTHAAYATRS